MYADSDVPMQATIQIVLFLNTQRRLRRKSHLKPPRYLANPRSFTHNSRVNAAGGFMLVVRSRGFQLGSMLVTALSISMLPTAGRAYTADQQQACTGDAFRLCGSEIPDVDRVTVCMIRNKAQLTPGCRAFFGPSEAEVTPVGAGRPIRKYVGAHRPRKQAKPDAN
jgi:hypothetical protein